MADRQELLHKLIQLEDNFDDTLLLLKQHDWDSDQELVALKREDIQKALGQYQNSQITSGRVVEWANAIEGRDDIEFENESMEDIIFELANPLLTQKLTLQSAQRILGALEN